MHWQWAPVCAPVGAASGREPSWHRASRAGIARAGLPCGNTDDHARNHAVFWDGQMLSLTPASLQSGKGGV
jgi:hypothetical protein